MGTLDDVQQMKREGIADEEIVGKMQEQGLSPKEINDAIEKSKISGTVSQIEDAEEMQPSITKQNPNIGSQTQEISEEETYAPQPQQEGYLPQQENYQPQQEGYLPQEMYPEEGNYPAVGEDETSSMIEIAEQIFSEKIKKIKKQVENTTEFKILAQKEINNTAKRLKKIENVINKLQTEIMEKIDSYYTGLENTKKEMTMIQDSFAKMVNTLADNAESLNQQTQIKTTKKQTNQLMNTTQLPKKISKKKK